MLFTALFFYMRLYLLWAVTWEFTYKNMLQKISYCITIFIKLIHFIEDFTENFLFRVTTALKLEADISVRCMLFILWILGTLFQDICYKCKQKKSKWILTRNKPCSPAPANICLAAVTQWRWRCGRFSERMRAGSWRRPWSSTGCSMWPCPSEQKQCCRAAGSQHPQAEAGWGRAEAAGAARSLWCRLRSLWLRTSCCFRSSVMLLGERKQQQILLFSFSPSTYSF